MIKLFLYFSVTLLLSACSHMPQSIITENKVVDRQIDQAHRLYTQKQFEAAKAQYLAIDINTVSRSKAVEVYLKLAAISMYQREYKQANVYLDSALAIDRRMSQAHYNKGVSHLLLAELHLGHYLALEDATAYLHVESMLQILEVLKSEVQSRQLAECYGL